MEGNMQGKWKLKEPRMKNPRAGWVWNEFGIDVECSTPDELAGKIKSMRQANNVEVGDPMGDICRRLSETDPWMVCYAPDKENAVEKRTDMFTEIVQSSTFHFLRNPSSFIHVYDQKKRAEVCEGCPFNKELTFPTETERDRYWKSLMIASRGSCENYPKLKGCELHGHDNRLAVLMESVSYERECCGEGVIPKWCWVKKV